MPFVSLMTRSSAHTRFVELYLYSAGVIDVYLHNSSQGETAYVRVKEDTTHRDRSRSRSPRRSPHRSRSRSRSPRKDRERSPPRYSPRRSRSATRSRSRSRS